MITTTEQNAELNRLLGLEYFGTSVSGDTDLLSLDQLNALDYTAGDSQELLGNEYRAEMRAGGERVAWLQAIEGSVGPQGQMATVQGVYFVRHYLMDEVRVDIYNDAPTVEEQQIGLISDGSLRISFMPDEIAPQPFDRFVLLDREQPFRLVLKPQSAQVWPLPHSFIKSLDTAYVDGAKLRPSTYRPAQSGKGIEWIGTPPVVPVTVLGSYHPTYKWRGENIKQGLMGVDGVRLPMSGPLELLSAGEE